MKVLSPGLGPALPPEVPLATLTGKSSDPKTDLLLHTATIVAAYVGRNPVAQQDLSALIYQVHASLASVVSEVAPGSKDELKPAIPIKQSVTADYIVCLEDGKKFKSLKRHLRSHYNLSPEEYREKWGLRHDYPMVAPNYAEARSQLAKKMGLGTRREK